MLDGLFLSVLNMSITASLVILVVLLVRLLLKKAPKTFSYALWIVVLFRLICPFSFESAIGLLPINKTPIPQDIMYSTEPQIDTGINIVDSIVNPILPVANNMGESINPLQVWVLVGSTIWVFGMLIMLIYSIIQFVRLKRKLVGATPLRGNIYLADHISSPFVMGFIKPNIYLPSSMAKTEQAFIIAHENYHIKRFDHIARILGFIALTIHWLNPLVWLAFVLSGKDMEMSCDEAVMREMDTDIRAEYSKSLLRFATGRKIIAATPLAFGEGDTKERVKNVMQYKRPMLWVSIIAVIAVVCVVVGLMSNSKSEPASTQTGNQSIEQLWENRTEYVGNNVAVGNIILGLSFPEKLKYNGIELHTSEPPYSITVDFETDTDTRNFYTGELNQTPLKQNAIIMFSLIENVEQIIFNFDDGKNPYAETFYRDSAQAIMEDENLFARTETLESFISFIEEISIKLDANTDVQSNSQRDMKYKTESEFLNSPDGVKFQSTAYKAAKAYLSGNTDELLQYATESLTIDTTHDLFKDIDYMILKWSLDDIKDKDKIHAAYEFKLKGDDSVSYVSMELIRLDSEWKVDTVGIEK
ncbi:M56 family metallopeptidase [Agathobaculum sp. NTUH-O15-33]|uniref:M56 family metallopeptidase n=1 Tax=Agathobaculum sp. NTUH-O15-33 TaxID=3079302 RepID=UPI002958A6A5|nr:M56 family metallopeptidase [Agathobaculum sp. NTUH-O15-33]WNX85293.1 M56 family metallopeptidase [Agathobaculum sp. NTUH-O15-33]